MRDYTFKRLTKRQMSPAMPSDSERNCDRCNCLITGKDYHTINGLLCESCATGTQAMTPSDQDPYEYDDDSEGCYHCGGKRYVITCPDDLCATSDSCMHGDGEEDCPVCNANGEHEWNI